MASMSIRRLTGSVNCLYALSIAGGPCYMRLTDSDILELACTVVPHKLYNHWCNYSQFGIVIALIKGPGSIGDIGCYQASAS
eukprot:6183165-Pleurochrysis_carterae.AAC.5